MDGKKSKKSVTAKSRAKYKCPEKLAALISTINAVDEAPTDPDPANNPSLRLRSISQAIHDMSRMANDPAWTLVGAWPRITFDLTLDADGRIGFPAFETLDALIGVDAKRLRECEMCQRIFWARQDNMVACGPRCSNANRQRRHRERQYGKSRK